MIMGKWWSKMRKKKMNGHGTHLFPALSLFTCPRLVKYYSSPCHHQNYPQAELWNSFMSSQFSFINLPLKLNRNLFRSAFQSLVYMKKLGRKINTVNHNLFFITRTDFSNMNNWLFFIVIGCCCWWESRNEIKNFRKSRLKLRRLLLNLSNLIWAHMKLNMKKNEQLLLIQSLSLWISWVWMLMRNRLVMIIIVKVITLQFVSSQMYQFRRNLSDERWNILTSDDAHNVVQIQMFMQLY